MRIQILPLRLLAASILLVWSIELIAQQNNNRTVPAGPSVVPGKASELSEEYAHIFILYPIVRSGDGFSVFLNRKNIGKLSNGGRVMCRLLSEGPVAVTLIEGIKYTEPFTQSKNSRTISIKKGKSYYFRANGTGVLEYIFDAGKGEKSFANAKEFNAPPGSFTETSGDSIPLLANNIN